MALDGIFDTTINLLEKSLDLRVRNHNFISANIANAETPGYIPTTLSFEGELKAALKNKGETATAVTNPRHIPLKGQGSTLDGVTGTVTETPSGTPGRDGNGVELENEMGKLAENQILYNAAVQIAAKQFDSLKTAIKGSI
ncbi:MAG TPA: flagellar basal body rod protein FlgB [Geobacteraceae bacterium]|nr:flagellar basal body rod protein FlgB [Geobacteraceae bacterium]